MNISPISAMQCFLSFGVEPPEIRRKLTVVNVACITTENGEGEEVPLLSSGIKHAKEACTVRGGLPGACSVGGLIGWRVHRDFS